MGGIKGGPLRKHGVEKGFSQMLRLRLPRASKRRI
jgi:hypothetical protein